MSSLLILAVAACSEPAQVGSKEGATPSEESVSLPGTFVAANTSEELAFLATRVCLPQVTEESGVGVDDLEKLLSDHGYRLRSDAASRQAFGQAVAGFVAAEKKDSEFGSFAVAFGGPLPACVTLLTDDSKIPPVAELRTAFESQGWEWQYMGAVRPARLPYAGFKRKDHNGKIILAVLNDEPESDRTVRLGIDISYTDF